MLPTYYARVADDWKLSARCPVLAGKDVVIRERKAQRSSNQNRRYFALLKAAADELGYDDLEELHEGLAQKFLPLPELVPGVPRRRRTPKLDTREFVMYADAVERFLRTDLGLALEGWDDDPTLHEV